MLPATGRSVLDQLRVIAVGLQNPLAAFCDYLSSAEYSSISHTFAQKHCGMDRLPTFAQYHAATSCAREHLNHRWLSNATRPAVLDVLNASLPDDTRTKAHLRSMKPYYELMRLDKPTGTWLLMWPGFWSIALAAHAGHWPNLEMLAYFGVGAVLLRGAGCTINDLWDRDLDKRVERTRMRPLAAGLITPAQATGALAVQLLLGLGILLQLNDYTKVLGASSLLLVGMYPAMKRITHWPQLVLGLTMNWGALMGWAAVRGSCDWAAVLPLYTAGICWTLIYDTIYAHQDKKDDLQVGIKSTALLFGNNTKPWLAGFGAINAASLMAAGVATNCGMTYYVGATAALAHLWWQIAAVDLDQPQDCQAKFVANKWYGAMVFAAITSDRLTGGGL